jgi:hypothetical protein
LLLLRLLLLQLAYLLHLHQPTCKMPFSHQLCCLPYLLLVLLRLQHHVNPEHAAHHAAADAKTVAYDGSDHHHHHHVTHYDGSDGSDAADVQRLPSRGNGSS